MYQFNFRNMYSISNQVKLSPVKKFMNFINSFTVSNSTKQFCDFLSIRSESQQMQVDSIDIFVQGIPKSSKKIPGKIPGNILTSKSTLKNMPIVDKKTVQNSPVIKLRCLQNKSLLERRNFKISPLLDFK